MWSPYQLECSSNSKATAPEVTQQDVTQPTEPTDQYPAFVSTRCIGTSSPHRNPGKLFTKRRTLSCKNVAVKSALCGDNNTFSNSHKGLSVGRGSVQKTSRAAPLPDSKRVRIERMKWGRTRKGYTVTTPPGNRFVETSADRLQGRDSHPS